MNVVVRSTLDKSALSPVVHRAVSALDAGLPVVGFMAYNVINTQAQPGMLANYSGTYRHRSTMSCNGPAGECASVITGGGQ